MSLDVYALPLGGSGAKAKRTKARRLVSGGMSANEAAKEAGLTGANVALFKTQQKQGQRNGPDRLAMAQERSSGNPELAGRRGERGRAVRGNRQIAEQVQRARSLSDYVKGNRYQFRNRDDVERSRQLWMES